MSAFISLVFALVLLPGPGQVPAKAKKPQKSPQQAKKVDAARRLQALQESLEALRGLLQNRIDVQALRSALKNRKPKYRVLQPPKPKPAPGQETPAVPPKPGQVQSTPGEAPEKPKVVTAPTRKIGAPGDVVLDADGIPITRGEIEKISGFIMSYSPDLPPEECQRKALEALLVRAHLESIYKDRLPAMKKKIQAIRKRIVEKGEIFADVAREVSDCPSKKQGGDLGEIGHGQMVQPFEYYAFTTPKGQVSPVFLSPFGYHILKVIQEPRGMDPASMKVRVRHILVAFDKDTNKLRDLIREAKAGKVKIKVLDPTIEPVIPPQYAH